jgi:hypothetical protein
MQDVRASASDYPHIDSIARLSSRRAVEIGKSDKGVLPMTVTAKFHSKIWP